MHFDDHIIQVALLGTDKQQLNLNEADDALQPSLRKIGDNPTLDSEEIFLQSLALAFNYKQAGVTVPVKVEAAIEPAPAEEKQYCSPAAMRNLRDILDLESGALLRVWLQCCADADFVVLPEFIPILFDEASVNRSLLPLVIKCCGKRGEWLIGFNKDWKFSATDNTAEIWETGSSEQRKQALMQVRKADAGKALQMLEQTWTTEDAQTKTVLLGVLETNIGNEDVRFLEQIQNEKSKKVNDLAIHLLKLIPASSIVQSYVDALRKSVQIKKEKSMLGLISKKVLDVDVSSVDESVFATGIEKLSNIKDLDDATYIACQLIQNVPPSALKTLLGVDYEEMANLFWQKKSFLLFALIGSAIKFRDVVCLQIALQKDNVNFYKRAITILPKVEANNYAEQYFAQQNGIQGANIRTEIIDTFCKAEIEISSSFGAVICEHLASDMYRFNRKFYNDYIDLFPADFPAIAEKYTPQQSYVQSQWGNTVAYTQKLMQLKVSTIHHLSTRKNN
ncbi:DUF5691 domain-containing protein [Taibaiella soli]|uniref:Uncharacterized protein n=1 Tax=Taibaiella soli TaxID=1649169 RepID=A0A2W2C205_9BACT|nr:DUF5691 domain-containing protein [Taibaiella soli]PZF74103.1 hypothetical protein DN068_03560 [Taibaiella soli]